MSERKTTGSNKPAAKRLRLNSTCSSTGFSSAAALLDSTNRRGSGNDGEKQRASTDNAMQQPHQESKRGFCSAATVLDSLDLVDGSEKKRAPVDNVEQQQLDAPKRGFCSATAVLDAPDLVGNGDERRALADNASQGETNDVNQEPKEFQITLTTVGWKYYKDQHEASNLPSRGTIVELQREVDNEHDANAIAVLSTLNRLKVGHITKDNAALLAPHVDTGAIRISSTSIRKCHKSSFQILVEGVSNGSNAAADVVNQFVSRSLIDMEALTQKIAKLDVERSQCAPYMLKDLKALPWNPLPDWKVATEMPSLSWAAPFDPPKFHSPPLTTKEIEAAKTASWPPSDDILLRLGMAPANDEEWWYRVAGLLPPSQWYVTGALDVLPCVQTSARSQANMASNTLDGAIHGVTGVWHPDTLAAMGELMQEPRFWCRRSGDALIRAFGGPYVLGQEAEKLKLVRGAPHTELTQKMCVAHNLVYTVVHLVHPAAPRFNTLIFGCNLRGAGFHFHQDAVPSLKAKNAPLIPRQPVVTTVFYENPEVDSGKEIVMWKPILNFSPIASKSTGTGEYLGARAVPTLHGMVHLQRAGLQKSAVHGIFHAPNTIERKGYRVAITARITKHNAEESLCDYMHQYVADLGPEGDLQLLPKGN